jgi:hypothetical protein
LRAAGAWLEPPDKATGPDAHPLNLEAFAWFTNPDHLYKRKALLPMLLCRKRRGTRAEPVRRKQGELHGNAVEQTERQRREEVAADIMRLVGWCVLRCNWRTNEIGDYREGRIHFLTRVNIAERAGFARRIDAKDRTRAYGLDDRMNDAIAAQLLLRPVDEDNQGAPTEFKVKRLVWELAGVAVKRDLALAAAKKKKREAERPVPAVASIVAELAHGADAKRDDYFASAAESPPEARGWVTKPKPKPPPT